MKVAVIGDGGWGTALALILAGHRHEVTVWGPFEEYLRTLRETGENAKFLPGVKLPSALRWTARLDEAAAGAEAVVLATPSRYFRPTVSALASALPRPRPPIVSVTKGLDERTLRRMTEVAGELLGEKDIAALSGPSLAAEVARGVPTAVTLACADAERAAALQQLFNGPQFRVYTSDDAVGVELGGALKNVIAIAAGVCDGIGFGDNAKAALITRGLAEIARLGVAMGAHPQTFAGLSGLGDLVVTCASRLSRNRGVGERLGRGESMEAILQGMQQVAEGVWTCGAARDLARTKNVEVPITEEVCAVVHGGKSPRRAVEDLMSRDPRPERE